MKPFLASCAVVRARSSQRVAEQIISTCSIFADLLRLIITLYCFLAKSL